MFARFIVLPFIIKSLLKRPRRCHHPAPGAMRQGLFEQIFRKHGYIINMGILFPIIVYHINMCIYIYIYIILPLHIPYAPCMEYESQHLPEQHHPNVGKYTMGKHGKKGNTWDMLISSSIQGFFFFRTKPNLNISKTHISLYEYTAHDSFRLYLPEDWSQNGGLASIAHWKGNLCYTMECWSTSPVAKN